MKLRDTLAAVAIVFAANGVAATPATAQPALVKQVPPEYPRGAERRKIEGSVTLTFDVDASGKTSNIAVVDASMPGVFDKAAEKALEQWRFEEGQTGNAISVTIDFKLN